MRKRFRGAPAVTLEVSSKRRLAKLAISRRPRQFGMHIFLARCLERTAAIPGPTFSVGYTARDGSYTAVGKMPRRQLVVVRDVGCFAVEKEALRQAVRSG